MEVLISGISGGVVLLALGVAFKVTNKRVDTVATKMDGKQDKTLCDVVESHVAEKFARGNTKFSELETKTDTLLQIQNDQNVLLARIDERIGKIVVKNGIK